MKMTMTSAGSRNIPAIITLPKNTDEKYSLAVWSSPLWMWIVIKRLAIVFNADTTIWAYNTNWLANVTNP